jgi:S-methylmethionine-dependent homocysteine/selenocysteine methylase
MTKSELKSYIRKLKKPLILDGAVGSLLQQTENDVDNNLWTSHLNFKKPEVVKKLHEDYLEAGADIITTNTFRTNPAAVKRAGKDLDINKLLKQSVELARNTADKFNRLVAGSNPPAEDCYQTKRTLKYYDLVDNHEQHIDLLYYHKVDFILNETLSHFDEIKIICNYCSRKDIPFVISLLVTEDLKILSGAYITDVIKFVKKYNPLLISFNCISKKVLDKIINTISLNFNWGFYLNCGGGNYTDQNIKCGIDEFEYAEIVKTYLDYKPKLIGACCGSNPKHIYELKKILNG